MVVVYLRVCAPGSEGSHFHWLLHYMYHPNNPVILDSDRTTTRLFPDGELHEDHRTWERILPIESSDGDKTPIIGFLLSRTYG